MKINILQFAKLPPPIGGVSIHVSRLISQTKVNQEFNMKVLDYSKEKKIFSIINKIFTSKIIHVHLSNKKLRFFFAFLFKLMFKKVIITFHGKYDFENIFDKLSLKLSSACILLNDFSYSHAERIKKKGIYKIGAFIPPLENEIVPLKTVIREKLKYLNEKYQKVFCTNASSVAYDKKGREIYMGTEIIEYFQNKKKIALVFSCPSEEYFNFLKEKFNSFSENIYFINEKHDFINIIRNTNALIRATTMDGDSLSVNEAIFCNKQVFATSIVDRPKGVILFSNFSDFNKKYTYSDMSMHNVEDNSSKIFSLYNFLLKQI